MIKNILKGIVIGIANIIPGVSGGTLAVSMGIYDKIISSVTNIRKNFKQSVVFLFPIFLGALFSIAALSFIIELLFDQFPLQTNFLFIGLIIGGLPGILKNVKGEKISARTMLPLLLLFIAVIGMTLLGRVQGNGSVELNPGLQNTVILFGIGVIAAATMVIPGVSGSMILMLLGFYEPIITTINNFLTCLFQFNIGGCLEYMVILLPFGLGVVTGVLLIAKIIEFIFSKWRTCAYFAIIGLILASPISIMLLSEIDQITIMSALISGIMLIAGAYAANRLGS